MIKGLKNYFPIVVIAGLHFSYFVTTVDNGQDWGDDFALYIEQTIALDNGSTEELLAENRYAMENSVRRIGPDLYPIGFPLMLLPVYKLFGLNLISFKYLIEACFIVFLFLAFYYFRRKSSAGLSGLIFLTIFTHHVFINISDRILTDVPSLAAIYLCLCLAEYACAGGNVRRQFNAALLGLLLAFTCLLRTMNISLVAGIELFFLIDFLPAWRSRSLKENLKHPVFLTGLTFLSGMIAASLLYPTGSGTYVDQLDGLTGENIIANIKYYFHQPKDWLYRSDLIFYPLYAFLFAGIYFSLRSRKNQLIILYFTIHIIMLVFWPFIEGLRFVYMFIPVYWFFVFTGFNAVAGKFQLKWLKYTAYAFIGGLIIYNLVLTIPRLGEPLEGKHYATGPEAIAMFAVIKEQSKEDDLISFFKPRAMRLYSGRSSIELKDPEEMIAAGVDYAVLSAWDKPIFHPRFALIFKNEFYTVLKITPKTE